MLGRAVSLVDVGKVAAFAASALARTLTGTVINISCGAVVDGALSIEPWRLSPVD
ncbi:hypothetical protein ACVBEQ_26060 [Nakamurella sp. GG22]